MHVVGAQRRIEARPGSHSLNIVLHATIIVLDGPNSCIHFTFLPIFIDPALNKLVNLFPAVKVESTSYHGNKDCLPRNNILRPDSRASMNMAVMYFL